MDASSWSTAGGVGNKEDLTALDHGARAHYSLTRSQWRDSASGLVIILAQSFIFGAVEAALLLLHLKMIERRKFDIWKGSNLEQRCFEWSDVLHEVMIKKFISTSCGSQLSTIL